MRLGILADRISTERRSWNMSRIRSRDTCPELRVRSMLHGLGYRFRLHDRSLPGRPDVVLKKHRVAIFVNGCYWHRHQGCKQGAYFPKDPKQGIEFWREKFDKNVQRDQKNRLLLEEMGWRVAIVWECQTKDDAALKREIDKIFIH